MEVLKLTEFYPKALTLKHVVKLSESITDNKCLQVVKKIIMLDKSALLTEFGSISGEVEKSESLNKGSTTLPRRTTGQRSRTTDAIHPMDVLNVIFNCCDNVLLQILVEKLFMLQLSIPLVFPDCNQNDNLTCLLWSLRGIVPECRTTDSQQQNLSLVNIPMPFVSFLRIGQLNQSKSKLINSWFRPDQYDTFFHRSCKNGKQRRMLADGTIEATWCQPLENTAKSIYGILNLRGEASKYSEQVSLLCEVSSLICLILNTKSLNTSCVSNFSEYLRRTKAAVVLCFMANSQQDVEEHTEDCLNFADDFKNKQINIVDQIFNWSDDNDLLHADDLKDDIIEVINKHFERLVFKSSLETLANIARGMTNCSVDEDDPRCVNACKEVKRLFNFSRFDTMDELERKSTLLPLQGKLWQEWADVSRTKYRNQEQDNSLEEFTAKKEEAQNEARQRQFQLMQNGRREFIKSICSRLQTRQTQLDSQYFLIWMRLILDEYSRKVMPKLHKNYADTLNLKRSDMKISTEMIESNLFDLETKLSKASFGIGEYFQRIRSNV